MQKRATIFTIVIVTLIFLGISVGIYVLTSAKYNNKVSTLTREIETAQSELDALKAAKDTNGFTATEAVKAFFTESKAGSVDKAKLYLGPEVQAMDIKATLKLGNDLSNVSMGENLEEVTGDTTSVSMTFILPNEETTVRVFELTRFEDAWKITGVTAE